MRWGSTGFRGPPPTSTCSKLRSTAVRKRTAEPLEGSRRHNELVLWLSVCSDLREAVTRLRSAEVNAVSGLLKLYIRDLPEALIPAEMFQSLAKTLGNTIQISTFLKIKQYFLYIMLLGLNHIKT